MSYEDDLYKEIILEHYKSKKNRRAIDNPSAQMEGANPSCGDDVELFVSVGDDGTIADASYQGVGCSICIASADMLCDSLKGRSVDEAKDLIGDFKSMLLENTEPEFPDEISDLDAMQGVKNYPVRIKCALLSWNTMDAMIKSLN